MAEQEKGLTDGVEENGVCISLDLFPSMIDALQSVERTAFVNGTCLLVSALQGAGMVPHGDRLVPMYTISAEPEDKSVDVGLSLHLPIGQCSLVCFVGYVLALTLDRESWRFGEVPKHDALLASLGDCLHVLRELDENEFAEWLHVRAVKMLGEWEKNASEQQMAKTPKGTAEA